MSEIVRKSFYDPSAREITFATFQDVEPIIEQNKALSSIEQTGESFYHKATVPLNVIHMWLQEEWDNGNIGIRWGSEEFDSLLVRKLADPDNRVFLVDGPRHRVGYGS